jgi:hypothetical protein
VDGRRRIPRALVAILVAGAALRLVFVFAWQPAFMGWPDAASYIDVSQGPLFSNALRPAGYPLFLHMLHLVAPSLALVIALQHLLGLATAVLLYLTVGRSGAPPAWGLLPAAVVALGADGVFLEHAAVSESLFMFLVAAALYCGVRSLDGERLVWPAACGLLLAFAASVRVVAVPLFAVFALWMLIAPAASFKRRLVLTGAGALAMLAVMGPYYAAEQHQTGRVGLSRNGIWNLYGRVAPFADCHKFTPPPPTQLLCETTPRSERPLTYQYTFNWYYSPAVRYFDNPHVATAAETDDVAAFAWSVIWGQPLDYATEVGAGLLRYVAPNSFEGYGGGPSYDDLVHGKILFNRMFQKEGLAVARAKHYTDAGHFKVRRGLLGALRRYESVTRIEGVLFVLLALLSLAGPLLARGRARRAAALCALTAWTLMVVPVATVEFSARTAVPGFGALGAAAAVGGFALLAALRERGRSSSSAGGGHGHARAATSGA